MIEHSTVFSTVLLINDDDAEISTMRDTLTHMGFEVFVVESPSEAQQFCQLRRPNIVVADIEMAGGNGFEAISAVRRVSKDCRIIAVTRGGHQEIWPMIGSVCGADTYLTGPVSAPKLTAVLQSNRNRSVMD